MTGKIEGRLTGGPTSESGAVSADPWAEQQRRSVDREPYTGGVTADALMERFEEVRQREPRVRHSRQDYAHAVSSYEAPPSVDTRFSDEDDLEPELPWVADLPEGDRRLFAEEMAQLMAVAAQTDDFAEVDQALRDWRVTSLTYSDPDLAHLFSKPIVANGDRVPRPVI